MRDDRPAGRTGSNLPPAYPAKPAAAPSVPAPASTAKPAEEQANYKETVESILIAFILAFIFRAFVVEAFVIPTGSMAPTLMGAHMHFRCPDCGYVFDVNYSNPQQRPRKGEVDGGGEIDTPPDAYQQGDVYCPNCGYHLLNALDHRYNSGSGQDELVALPGASTQPVLYGDRILVLKYIYLLHAPQRWDVVVFKSPSEGPAYDTNFIKRLVGKPGETVMVLDGDVYVKGPGEPQFTIQAKPPEVQEAMWRIVHDNDFLPHLSRIPQWKQPWMVRGGSGWNVGAAGSPARVFQFDNANGSSTLQFNPGANPVTFALTDFLAYDGVEYGNWWHGLSRADEGALNNVSDLKLVTYYQRQSGQGPLQLRLTKLGRTFTAEIGPDSFRLLQSTGGPDVELIPPKKLSEAGIKPGQPIFIEFMNVDYRVSLRLNRQEVLSTTPDQYHPDLDPRSKDNLLTAYFAHRHQPPPVVQIVADQQACSLSHLSLWRDVYYTNHHNAQGDDSGAESNEWRHATPRNPMVLGKDEYFVLGDNSAISGDGRDWQSPVDLKQDEDLTIEAGRVPGRFMLGKAFFVYWPAGYRPVNNNFPALVPNFGQMRFIH